jgi:hypothetical protein
LARANGDKVRAGGRQTSPHLVALAVYVAATLVALSAVMPDLAHRTFRSFSGDNFADFWNLWWVHEAISQGRSIFFTNLLYFPAGTSLSFTEFGPLYGLLSVPFFAISNTIATAAFAHNFWVSVTFVLCGYATFLFARRLSGSTAGAMLAGLLVAFAPFRIHHLEHLNLLSNYWIPLAALAVAPWIFDLGAGRPGGRARKPGWTLLALVACGAGLAGTSFTNLAVTATFLAVWLAWTAILDRPRIRKGWPWRIPVAAAMVAIGTLPFIWEWLVWLVKSRAQVWSVEELARWSPDLFGFFTPPQGALLGGLSAAWAGRLHGVGGNEVFLGIVFTVLAVLGARRMGRPGLALLLTAATGLLLALGPGAWIGGKRIVAPLSLYAALETVFPFVGACRVPSRFVPMILFAMAPLAAAGFTVVRGRWGRLAYLLVPLALVESLAIPRGYDAVRTENLYVEMREDPTPGAVFELTLQRENPNVYAFRQIVHRRPLVSGHLPRVSLPALELEAKLDLRGRLTRPETAAAALEDLRGIGAAFFVLHRAGVPTEAWQQVTAFFEERAEVWNRSRERVVYRLRRDGPAAQREPEAEP